MPRPRSFLTILLLMAALVLFSASTLLAQPATDAPGKGPKTMTWVLTQGTVINPEQIDTKGKLTTGYVVEATATAQGQARVNTGKFTIRCTIEDKGDHFLLRGAWDITRIGAQKSTHGTPDSIKGNLVAKLDFNPAASVGQAGAARTIEAKTSVSPKRRTAGQEAKAAGTFTGDDKFNGTIVITRK